MTDHDLDWLVAERPEPIALAPGATARARADLLDHARASRRDSRRARRRPRPHRALRLAHLAVIGALIATVAVVLAVPGGQPAATRQAAAGRARMANVPVSAPVSGPLVRLSDYIRSGPRPRGDATLVLRTQTYPDSPTITGADLYTDSGKYFYAETLAGLPQAIAEDADQGGGFIQRELAAARLAANGNVETARHAMAIATFDPGMKQVPPARARQVAMQKLGQLLARTSNPALRRNLQRVLGVLRHGGSPISRRAQEDNEVWENSLDALIAGAGDPLVRAGILRILSTMSEVKVAQATLDGQPALTITATAPALPSDYQEQLTINADTGVPIRFTGGTPGRPPGVTVTYRVSRVTVAAVESGH